MPLTLDPTQRRHAGRVHVALLDGIYEHSPWIAERAWAQRPFASAGALKHALVQAVREAGRDAQLALIRAHPELAGKAMVAKTLTAEAPTSRARPA
jgi:beta-ureidopropionase / N-carbamoyl-L-amino-acid hydrolase